MLIVSEHPLAGHLLAELRDKNTEPAQFREFARRLTTILALEATSDMGITADIVETPLEKSPAKRLASAIAAVPILRAGLAMLGPVTDLFPDVAVGYIGLERDENTAVAISYYKKLPKLEGKLTLLLDPMLATGGSAVQAVDLLKEAGAQEIRMICVVAAPEGRDNVERNHPDVRVFA